MFLSLLPQGLSLLALASLFACVLPGVERPDIKGPPNILFIIADDQSPFDLSAYDPSSPLETPVIDRLSAEGMTLDGAYHMGSWSGAVCTPSRHMVMSGRTLWHLPKNGVKGVKKNPLCPEDLAEHTLAAVFNRAGYDTMRTCKIGNSYAAANQQFTVCKDKTRRGASDEEGSAWHAEQVLSYLEERTETGDEDPFLIYYGFSHPHDPRWAKEELLEKYGADNDVVPEEAHPKSPPLPENYLPEHPFPHGHPGLRDEVKVQGVMKRRDEPTIRNEIGRQFACNENIDIQIGRVLEKLEEMGELDNTYIVYTADHGMAIGRHGLQGKQNLYEHTWRVPMIVKGPGIEPGSRSQGNVYLLDVLATLCDLAGVPAPESSEGTSFAPVLEGERETVRDVLYGAYCGGTKPGMRCVRRGDWKLIKYDTLGGEVHETQLFDLSRNPSELIEEHHAEAVSGLTGNVPSTHQKNLAGDPRHATKLAEMEALLLEEMERLEDPYRLWDQSTTDKPVKVYILSGQSNMVGIGQVSGGTTRWGKEIIDPVVSVYAGPYSAEADYDSMTPTATKELPVYGGTEPTPFPGGGTQVVRGFIELATDGVFEFSPGYSNSTHNVMEVAGVEVYRREPGQEATQTAFQFKGGERHPFKITFFTNAADGLGWLWRTDLPGTLSTVVKTEGKFPHLLDAEGRWAVRDDVWYKGLVTATANKWLTVGCGANGNSIGPELQFGHVLGEHHDEPVIVIKTSQGNRSLGWDFLPPDSARFSYEGRTYAGSGDKIPSWTADDPGKEVNWYAGLQYDQCFEAVHEVLDNFAAHFPQYEEQGFEIAGFAWWQGHKDGNAAHASRYEFNLVKLIKSLRAEFDAPNAPFVIGTIGFGGWEMAGPHLTVANAQLAVSGETGKYPEFAGNVLTGEIRDFWKDASISPRDQGFHYNGNAETYLLVGDVLGRGMVRLLENQ